MLKRVEMTELTLLEVHSQYLMRTSGSASVLRFLLLQTVPKGVHVLLRVLRSREQGIALIFLHYAFYLENRPEVVQKATLCSLLLL